MPWRRHTTFMLRRLFGAQMETDDASVQQSPWVVGQQLAPPILDMTRVIPEFTFFHSVDAWRRPGRMGSAPFMGSSAFR
jgi:hypothetical protein